LAKAKKMTPEELEGKIITGLLHTDDKTEFCDEYKKVVEKLKGK
jgi:2-oxoglutarate/2-oxoacid ferredoxin oxidoreductase subunit beta